MKFLTNNIIGSLISRKFDRGAEIARLKQDLKIIGVYRDQVNTDFWKSFNKTGLEIAAEYEKDIFTLVADTDKNKNMIDFSRSMALAIRSLINIMDETLNCEDGKIQKLKDYEKETPFIVKPQG